MHCTELPVEYWLPNVILHTITFGVENTLYRVTCWVSGAKCNCTHNYIWCRKWGASWAELFPSRRAGATYLILNICDNMDNMDNMYYIDKGGSTRLEARGLGGFILSDFGVTILQIWSYNCAKIIPWKSKWSHWRSTCPKWVQMDPRERSGAPKGRQSKPSWI